MSDDKQLQQAVMAELNWEPSVTAAHIGVTAKAGVITLTGHVASFVEKYAAETAVSRVKGVKAVAEELEVRLPFEIKRGDEEIAAAATNALSWDISVPHDAIKAKVEKGWITLTGRVDWHFQSEAAESAVSGLIGVVGVSNGIAIKPTVNAKNLSDDITHALHRSWFFDPQLVKVSANGGDIKLSGTVPSWHDRELATNTAWSAPGVTSVENDIIVA
jgi:osmotically-inducible protein OsmY